MKMLHAKQNWLVSHAFIRDKKRLLDLLLACAPHVRLLIDSGAFTNYSIRAFNKKSAPVTLPDYMQACRAWYGQAWQYIQLDAVRDPKTTRRNLLAMRDAGLAPMPAWVMGEQEQRIPELLDLAGTDWLAVPGGTLRSNRYGRYRYQTAYRASGARARIHALGFLRWPDVMQLPIVSGDSSSNVRGQRFGWMMGFEPAAGIIGARWVDLHRSHATPKGAWLIAYAERCGMTIDQLSKKESYYGRLSWASLSSVYTFIRMQDFTTPRGFLTFIVAISEQHLENMLAVLAHSREDSFDYPQAVATIKDWQALRSQKQTTKWVSALLKVLTTLTNRKEHDPAVRSFAPA